MKSLVHVLMLSLILFACQKSEPVPYGYSRTYSQSAGASTSTGGPFSFTSIEVNPNPVQKGTVAKVIAQATGSNLTFSWSTPHGDLFGTGSAIYYSDSCIGTFDVTCTVSDGTNSKTITVAITVTD